MTREAGSVLARKIHKLNARTPGTPTDFFFLHSKTAKRLGPSRRHLIDTVRMIAYRAETAMVALITDPYTDSTAARTILQAFSQVRF